MSDRLVTLAGALLALFAVCVLLAPPRSPGPESYSRPTSIDPGAEGLLGLSRWLQRGGVSVISLRRRYDALARDERLAATGNLLVITLPQYRRVRHDEAAALLEWVERGNQLLVNAAVAESTAWVAGSDPGSTSRLLESLGFELEVDTDGGSDEADGESPPRTEPEAIVLRPTFEHRVTDGVASAESRRIPFLDLAWRLRSTSEPRAVLTLLEQAGPGEAAGPAGALWAVRIGEGRAYIARHGGLFSNATLAAADNARLLANIVDESVRGYGAVIFDDAHQGLRDLYDPEAFFGDRRLHHTLGFLVGLWLLALVGRAQRLVAPRALARAPDASMLAHAMSGLLARRVRDPAVAARLFSNLFNEIRARSRLPTDGQPVWDLLQRSPAVTTAELARLRAGHAAALGGRRLDLTELASLMAHIRERMT